MNFSIKSSLSQILTNYRTTSLTMARNFYEDDELVVTKPGYNAAITPELKAKESIHGDVSFVDGMVIRSLPFLKSQLKTVREFLNEKISIYSSEINTQVSATSNELNSLNNQIQSSIKEPVLPNLIYILTVTLTGSVLSARRGLPLRAITPTVFGLGALRYYMPKTWEHNSNILLNYEAEQFPEVYKQQSKILNDVYEGRKQVEENVNLMGDKIQDGVHEARVFLNDLLN